MRPLTVVDRLVTGLVGLALVAGGLLLLDWRYRWVLDGYAAELDVSGATPVLDAPWWPAVLAAVGVLLALLGLRWLLAHLQRARPTSLRLGASDAGGRLEVDLGSLASAVADRYARLAPVSSARGSAATIGAQTVVEVRAHVEADGDAALLAEAAEECARDLAGAFPAGDVTCRILLHAPQRARTPRRQQLRVH